MTLEKHGVISDTAAIFKALGREYLNASAYKNTSTPEFCGLIGSELKFL